MNNETKSRRSYRDYNDAEGNHEEDKPMDLVYIAKIVAVARMDNGEFLPTPSEKYITVKNTDVMPVSEAFKCLEKMVKGAES